MRGITTVGAVCFLLLVFLVPTTSAGSSPTIYYVSTSGSDANDGLSWGGAFATIQRAVNIASPGDTIIVGDGTYVENVTVNKENLMILSENGATKTVMQTPGPYKSVFEVTVNNVTISGFTVKNTIEFHPEDPRISYIRIPVAGILLSQVNNCDISNNIAENNSNGIYLYLSSNNTLRNNIVKNNGNGILLERSDNSALENNTVENNSIGIWLVYSNNNALRNNIFVNDGLWVSESYGNFVENNTVNGKPLVYLENESDSMIASAGQVVLVGCDNITVKGLDLSNTSIGVELLGTDDSEIINNNVSSNLYGIYLYNSSNNTLKNNTAENNQYGVWLYAWPGELDNNTLENNTVENNDVGICVHNSSNNTLKNNVVENNMRGIYLLSGSSNNTFENNNILRNINGIYLDFSFNNVAYFNNIVWNSEYGVFNESGDALHAENNWWGDPSGPSGAGPGMGDAVSEYVYYELWLDAPVGAYGVSVRISPASRSGKPGETLTYTVTVSNTGAENDTYSLEVVDNAGWGPMLSENSLTIAAGAWDNVTLNLTIPDNVASGDQTVVTVTAISRGVPIVSDSANCIAAAEVVGAPPPEIPWVYIGVAIIILVTISAALVRWLWKGAMPKAVRLFQLRM